MRTGRPTSDKKEQTLKLRLNEEMREWVEEQSDRQGISMSEYIRCLIEADMERWKISQKSKRPLPPSRAELLNNIPVQKARGKENHDHTNWGNTIHSDHIRRTDVYMLCIFHEWVEVVEREWSAERGWVLLDDGKHCDIDMLHAEVTRCWVLLCRYASCLHSVKS